MTRTTKQAPRNEFDALQSQIDRTARSARECGFDPIFDFDDLAPARPIVWLVLAWVCLVAVFVLLLLAPMAVGATPPLKRTVPGTDTPPTTSTTVTNAGGNATAVTSTTTTNSNVNQSGANASGSAVNGPVTAGNSLTLNANGAAYAPDVIAYPTAPCRIAIGASGGGFTAVFGFTGSSEDENCTLRETSRQLWNVGQRDAAVQVLCLNDDARLALEASGVACKVKRAAAPAVERVTP